MRLWSGSVRSKIILPILATALVLGGYLYGVWLPEELQHEEKDHLELTQRHLESVAEGLFPLMVSEQLDAIYENLTVLKQQNPTWVSIRLLNRDGQQLYPLMLGDQGAKAAESEEVRLVRLPIHSQSVLLGWLVVKIDLGPTMDTVREQYRRLAGIFGGLVLLLALGVMVTVEAAVTHPLGELAEAARGLARRQFDTRLPKTSGDEVGSLVESFAAMREDLRAYHQSLETEIAEHQRAERALQELNATLETRVREEVENNRKKDHLMIQQSRSAAMGELAHNIAHQWRQPLNKIALLATNLGDDYADGALTAETLRRYQSKFGGIVRGLSETIDDFRNFFAPEEAAQPFDLAEAVKHAVLMVEAGFRDAGIELSLDLSESLIGHGFPHEFSQVVLNLLNNAKEAIQAHAGPREIRVRLAREGDFGVVRVSDSGGGIPGEILPKVFDPYFTTKDAGAGIGLYMVKMVMESMKGSVQAANGEQGAEFTLRIPLIPPVQ